jgi:hypothetical protein
MGLERTLYIILGNISAYGILFPLLLAIIRYKYLSKSLKFIFALFIAGALTEIASEIYINFIGDNNLWLLNSYQILETIIIVLFYYSLTNNKPKQIVILLFIMSFVFISIFYFLKVKSNSLNNFPYTVEAIAIIALVLLSFHSIFKKQIYSNLLNAPVFWVNSAFLIFFSGNIYLYLFSKYLQEHALNAFFEIWVFHSILNIIFFILISIGLWKTKKSQI